MTDQVDLILNQWSRERPDLDVSPMAVVGRLSRVARRFDERLARTFAEYGLDAGGFDVLATLRRTGAPFVLTPKDLAASSMVTSSATAQRLNRLEGHGLVSRTPSTADGRAIQVELTDRGRDVIDVALSAHIQTEHELLQELDSTERRILAELLARLDNS
jgi:DNA-binding MarR family transcriptional regulator